VPPAPVLVWWRYRAVAKTTRIAVAAGSNSAAAKRQARLRRKLYFMSLAVLVPYAPLEFYQLYLLIEGGLAPVDWWTQSASIENVHSGADYNFIPYVTSGMVGPLELNRAYIPIATTLSIFWTFGMSKDAINAYRKCLLFVGLGYCFPVLHKEYVPDTATNATMSFGIRLSNLVRSSRRGASAGSVSRRPLGGSHAALLCTKLPLHFHFHFHFHTVIADQGNLRCLRLANRVEPLSPQAPRDHRLCRHRTQRVTTSVLVALATST
jgi:hypothetical protein